MPELPEVECVVRTIRPSVVGRRIVHVEHVRADVVMPPGFEFARAVTGTTIASVQRRAKRIVFTLADGKQFYIHLGMTGQLTVESPEADRKKHTHLIATLDDGEQLRFVDARRFGGIHWLGEPTTADDEIGPEPLLIRGTTLAKRLAGTRRAVKVALLDQRVIAGIGNIYADESLWQARVHPLTPGSALTQAQVDQLGKAMKAILRRAIAAGGSTLRDYVNGRGERGGFQSRHRVYDRAGKPCRRCKSPIERIVLGGRSTHYCPSCQPHPSPWRSCKRRPHP